MGAPSKAFVFINSYKHLRKKLNIIFKYESIHRIPIWNLERKGAGDLF